MIDGDLKQRLLAAFRGESADRMRVLSNDFIRLEKGCGTEDLSAVIESSYRELHSLKGAARAVGLGMVEEFCQTFESFFAVLKKEGLVPSGRICSIMLGWLDLLEGMLREEDDSRDFKTSPQVQVAIALMKEFAESPQQIESECGAQDLEKATLVDKKDFEVFGKADCTDADSTTEGIKLEEGVEHHDHKQEHTITPTSMGDSVRISSSFLTGLLLQTEELISSRNSQRSRVHDISEMDTLLREFKLFFNDSQDKRIDSFSEEEMKLNALMDNKLDELSRRFNALEISTRRAERDLASKIDSLLGDFKNSMLLPFSSLLDVFPRMVRTLSLEQGKECRMESSGEKVRIDRRILEMLHDPLMHMMRNSIDHGIEDSEARKAAGKPSVGRIFFSITQTDRDVVKIVYGDDGRGIDLERLKAVAVSQGLISSDDAKKMDRRAALDLVFVSGMSTSEIITDISGRGLGMAIVRDKVESLGGSVVLASPAGKGFRVILNIPVALTSFRGIVVGSGGKKFVFPKSGVRKVLLVRQDDIVDTGGKETVFVLGRPHPLVSLADTLELGSQSNQSPSFPVLIVGKGRKAVAISVDELSGEQDVMVKSMGPLLKRVRNVSGFSMLGSGELVPILHTPDMARTAMGMHTAGQVRSVVHRQGVQERKTVLVAEDSITSRMLLKNVLEAAGYNVITAVNGLDALQKIEASLPDILVSDVEMPQMDGFTLTAKVRKMDNSASLPIILVTSLGSAEDRERGVDAGADAYIIKSNFDQGNLLEVIGRLAG
ncbi:MULTISPECIES: hybrid sensor histidine kinase/response regulator [unclassified Maridesulfovibrio]|uniref:hybrid sensor histidine kinase/response regulator n=1 Tax=unclassified Maridesulfovibrio TaxID=2794999 RepID=UPI003B3E6418